MVPRSCERPLATLCATSPVRPRWNPMLPVMSSTCVTRKVRKMGISTRIDSFTPRRLSTVSTAMAASSTGSFQECHSAGKLLKMASPPAATEVVQVRT